MENRTRYNAPKRPFNDQADDSASEDPRTRRRLNGAATKRFKFYLSRGVPPREARIKALNPMPITSRQDFNWWENERSKNDFPNDTKFECESENIEHQELAPNYYITPKEVGKFVKVGIFHSDYPDVDLTVEQMTQIKCELVNWIAEIDGGVSPIFRGSAFKPGWLLFFCDRPTAGWLREIVKKLKPWEGASLKLVEDKNLPMTKILTAHVQKSENLTNENILKLFQGQNKDLCTKEWRILERTVEENDTVLTLSIDLASLDKLRVVDFKVNYLFGNTTFKITSIGMKPPRIM